MTSGSRLNCNAEDNLMNQFSYLPLDITMKAMRSGNLPPYIGSAIRGALGHGIRRATCFSAGMDCTSCSKMPACIFPKVFSVMEEALHASEGNRTPPNSFVLHVMENPRNYKPGVRMKFRLTLFGHGAQYADYFILALTWFEELGLGVGRLPFQLEEITHAVTGANCKSTIPQQE